MTNRSSQALDAVFESFTTNIGTKAISVIIAIVLWIVVLGSRNVEVTKEVPVEVVTATELVPANDIPERVAFKLSGPKAFLRAILDRREEPIRVNLSGAKAGLVTYRFFAGDIHVPIGVKILGINPTNIVVKLEPLKHRDVPVKVEVLGTPPDGYRLSKVEVTPEIVRIKGAESKVDAVTELRSQPFEVSDMKESAQKEAVFDLPRYGVVIDGKVPTVKINVEPIAANFRIKNIDVHVTTHFNSRVEDKNVTVFIRADSKQLKSLDRSQVYGTVDLTGKPKGTYTLPLKLTLPPDVTMVKVVPDKVTVTLF